ncbi:MAG: DUF5668 domain-containing protein [Candidatus Promineifilaceae bacterium]|nr:DUF5668 domain-containing protein [Candidatus Promineifilaceae bacterium]
MSEEKGAERATPRRRKGRSMLGPVILITAGVLLLLSNLGLLPDPNWAAALRLWPLLLIALGLNIIVRQVARPVGTFLSLLVALGTVAIFGAVLLFAEEQPVLRRLSEPNLERQRVSIPGQDVTLIRLNVDGGSDLMQLSHLEDSDNLLEALVPGGDGHFDWTVEDDTAVVRLDADSLGSLGFFSFLDPTTWDDSERRVHLAVNDLQPLDLQVDAGSGPIQMDLSQLTLTYLAVDGGSGAVSMRLPAGAYDVELDVGSGPVSLDVVDVGQITLRIEGGSGPLTVALPARAAVQLQVELGSGPLSVDYPDLSRTGNGSNEERVWETAGFEDADEQLVIVLDGRSGPIRVAER